MNEEEERIFLAQLESALETNEKELEEVINEENKIRNKIDKIRRKVQTAIWYVKKMQKLKEKGNQELLTNLFDGFNEIIAEIREKLIPSLKEEVADGEKVDRISQGITHVLEKLTQEVELLKLQEAA